MDQETENLIDKKIDGLALAMHKGFEEVGGEINSIKQDLEKASQERHNELMNSNDKMIRIFEKSQQEMASQKFITDKQEEKLENHEKRIKVLELHKAV